MMEFRTYPLLKFEENIILYHHEKLDGMGFFGVVEDEIPLKSQIISFADYIDGGRRVY